jgi:hypothetical protein
VSGNVQGGNLRTAGTTTTTGVIVDPWNLGSTNIATVGGGSTASGKTLLGWNRSSGGGEFSIVVNRNGGSTGGLALYEWANTLTNTTTAVFNVTAAGVVSATGNITGANLNTAGLVSATGNITGGNLIAGTGTGGNITGANVITANTVTTTANITGGNILTSGLISATGTITGSSLTGTITTAAQTNITSVGTLTSLNVGAVTSTGLITGVNSAATDVNTANDAGSFSARGNTTTVASMTFHRTSAFAINMGLGVDNVFRIGGFSASNNCMQLSGTGAMTILSSLTLNSANGVTAIVNGGSNGVGNIGSSTSVFNTVFAKATSAQYADLAEKYTADAAYVPGTVLEFGGDQEVTSTTTSHSPRVAGIVSTMPSYIMNDGLVSDHTAMVSLTGRVPCLVQGPIAKGDRLVASNVAGHAQRLDPAQYEPGCIIGKALEDYPSQEIGCIEVAVGRF